MLSKLILQIKLSIEALVNYFVTLGMTDERKSEISYFSNMLLIIIYYFQLTGYIFSLDETKIVVSQDGIFIASIVENATVDFYILSFMIDWLSLTLFYLTISILILIYSNLFLQIFIKNKVKVKNNIFDKLTQQFFYYFQWALLLPFQEILTGVISCAENAIIIENIEYSKQECLQKESQIRVGFFMLCTILLVGIIIFQPFCFRNYEFLQLGLNKKFSIITIIVLLIEQFLVIINISGIFNTDVLNHILFICIIFFNLFLTFKNTIFGLSQEMKLFIKISILSLSFEIVVFIWLLNDKVQDHIIMMTTLLIFPLNNQLIETICEIFIQYTFFKCCKSKALFNCDCLELLQYYSSKEQQNNSDIMNLIKYLGFHYHYCVNLFCPCKHKQKQPIEQFIQYQFEQLVKQLNIQSTPTDVEEITTKFCSFLEKYRNNPIYSYKTIQEIIYTCQQMEKKTQGYQGIFFKHLALCIQQKYLHQIRFNQKTQSKLNFDDYLLLNDVKYYFEQEKYFKIELQKLLIKINEFWIKYKNGNINSINLFLEQQQHIQDLKIKILTAQNIYLQQRNQEIETLFSLRLKYLIQLCVSENFEEQLKVRKNILKIEQISLMSSTQNIFGPFSYQFNKALSLIINVNENSKGKIESKLTESCYKFFKFTTLNQIKLQYINDILPQNLAQVHDLLMNNFITTGSSKFLNSLNDIFILNAQNILEKVSLTFGSFFPKINDSSKLLMITHMIKENDLKIQDSLTEQNTGYILINQHLNIVGMTNIIYDKLFIDYINNKENTKQQLQNLRIDVLLPSIINDLIDFINIKNLRMQNEFIEQEKIIEKKKSLFIINYNALMNQNQKNNTITTIQSFQKYLSEIEIIETTQFQQKDSLAIEYSIYQKKLKFYNKENDVIQLLYFILKIEFYSNNKLLIPSIENISPNKYQFKTHSIQLEAEKNKQLLLEDNLRMQNKPELTYSRSINSSQNSFLQIQRINMHIKLQNNPILFYQYYCQFFILLVINCITIIFISSTYQSLKNYQSKCLDQINFELDFFNYYGQCIIGTLNYIYLNDFNNYITTNTVIINSNSLQFTSQIQLESSYLLINQSLSQLSLFTLNTTTIDEINSSEQIQELYFINYQFQQQYEQLSNRVLLLQFLVTYFNQYNQTKEEIYNNTNSFQQYYFRSILFFNFINSISYLSDTISKCQYQTITMYESQSKLMNNFCYAIYGIVVFLTFLQLLLTFQMKNLIYQYIKLFNNVDSEQCSDIIEYVQSLNNEIKQLNLIEQRCNFQFENQNEKRDFINSRQSSFFNQQQNGQNNSFIKHQSSKQHLNHSDKMKQRCQLSLTIIMHFLQLFLIVLYILIFQLIFINLQNEIQPYILQSLRAQEIRLNIMIVINRWTINLFQQYYIEYQNQQNMTILNEYYNYKIISQIEINHTLLQGELEYLINTGFQNEILESDGIIQLNQTIRDLLLNSDLCLLTGCSFNSLASNKYYSQELFPLFQEGILDIYDKVTRVIIDGSDQLSQTSTNNILEIINSIVSEQNYLIYFLWGYDLFQFQIQQLSTIFIKIVNQRQSQIQDFGLFYILIFGILMIISVSLIQIWIINYQQNTLIIIKKSISLIPLHLMIEKNFHQYIRDIKRKYYF